VKIVLKVQGEPIEQFRVTRFLSYAAKIFKRFDNAGTEQLLPIAVYCRTCSQGLSRRKEPSCEGKSIPWLSGGKRRKDGRYIGAQCGPGLGKKISALKFQSFSELICRLLRHHRCLNGRYFLQSLL